MRQRTLFPGRSERRKSREPSRSKTRQGEIFPLSKLERVERSEIDNAISSMFGPISASRLTPRESKNIQKAVKLYWRGKIPEAERVAGKWKHNTKFVLRDLAERVADRLLPEAKPGIQSQKEPGTVILYRTARDAREVRGAIDAIARGEPDEAFSPSTHVSPGLVGHTNAFVKKIETATRRGKKPLFTTPYPSVAGFYRNWSGTAAKGEHETVAMAPVTFALEVPEDAILHESSIATRDTGKSRSLVYPDTEIIVDAGRIKRAWHVPGKLADKMADEAKKVDEKLTRRGYMRSFRDADPELAGAAADAIADLREPPASLGRPFLEAPVPIGRAPAVKKGDRVVLAGGVVAEITGFRGRKQGPLGRTYVEIRSIPKRGRIEEWYRNNNLNVPEDLVLRVLPKGERYSPRMRSEDRGTKSMVEGEIKKYVRYLRDEEKKEGRSERGSRLRENIREKEDWLRDL